jgi:hypothetical protein
LGSGHAVALEEMDCKNTRGIKGYREVHRVVELWSVKVVQPIRNLFDLWHSEYSEIGGVIGRNCGVYAI